MRLHKTSSDYIKNGLAQYTSQPYAQPMKCMSLLTLLECRCFSSYMMREIKAMNLLPCEAKLSIYTFNDRLMMERESNTSF